MTSSTVTAKENGNPRATVIEPFLEIRTGPGRTYPIFYIAEKGERLILIKKRTDWVQVRLAGERVGWVHRHEIEKTLRASGHKRGLGERIYDDYIEDQLEIGWGWGRFERDDILYVRMRYLFSETISLEGNFGFASGDLGETDIYVGGLVISPWQGQWFSLFGTIGGGWITTQPANLLVNAQRDRFETAYAGVGFQAPLLKRLSIRGDFRNFTLFIGPERNREVQEYSLGVMFGF
ncbi:MAG: SH3 domain-containing protein [Nitrospiria bacterium]